MSKHRMPSGAGRPKESTVAPEETAPEDTAPEDTTVDDGPTTSTAREPEETAIAVVEDADENTEETAGDDVGTDPEDDAADDSDAGPTRRVNWRKAVVYGLLPAIALLLAMATGYFKWAQGSANDTDLAAADSPAAEAMRAAKDSTIAMLSYQSDTVEQQLGAAQNLLTGEFRTSYTSLTNDVVIPQAKQQEISAVTTVPAAAVVSADPDQAVLLVFVNQTVVVGQDAPTNTASSVRVVLDKVDDRWLISKFDPV